MRYLQYIYNKSVCLSSVYWFSFMTGVGVVVQIFPWFKTFQTSLIFTFLCLKSITIIRDKEKQKLNWFEKFYTKENFKPQHRKLQLTLVLRTPRYKGHPDNNGQQLNPRKK